MIIMKHLKMLGRIVNTQFNKLLTKKQRLVCAKLAEKIKNVEGADP